MLSEKDIILKHNENVILRKVGKVVKYYKGIHSSSSARIFKITPVTTEYKNQCEQLWGNMS